MHSTLEATDPGLRHYNDELRYSFWWSVVVWCKSLSVLNAVRTKVRDMRRTDTGSSSISWNLDCQRVITTRGKMKTRECQALLAHRCRLRGGTYVGSWWVLYFLTLLRSSWQRLHVMIHWPSVFEASYKTRNWQHLHASKNTRGTLAAAYIAAPELTQTQRVLRDLDHCWESWRKR